jgi:phosphoribosylglycinamide formyltransferase-1
VKDAFDAGLIDCSGFSMHFMDEEYDRGRVFAEVRVKLHHGMSADDIGSTVNAAEHRLQPWLTELVVTGKIRLEGDRLITPAGYEYLQIAA